MRNSLAALLVTCGITTVLLGWDAGTINGWTILGFIIGCIGIAVAE